MNVTRNEFTEKLMERLRAVCGVLDRRKYAARHTTEFLKRVVESVARECGATYEREWRVEGLTRVTHPVRCGVWRMHGHVDCVVTLPEGGGGRKGGGRGSGGRSRGGERVFIEIDRADKAWSLRKLEFCVGADGGGGGAPRPLLRGSLASSSGGGSGGEDCRVKAASCRLGLSEKRRDAASTLARPIGLVRRRDGAAPCASVRRTRDVGIWIRWRGRVAMRPAPSSNVCVVDLGEPRRMRVIGRPEIRKRNGSRRDAEARRTEKCGDFCAIMSEGLIERMCRGPSPPHRCHIYIYTTLKWYVDITILKWFLDFTTKEW